MTTAQQDAEQAAAVALEWQAINSQADDFVFDLLKQNNALFSTLSSLSSLSLSAADVAPPAYAPAPPTQQNEASAKERKEDLERKKMLKREKEAMVEKARKEVEECREDRLSPPSPSSSSSPSPAVLSAHLTTLEELVNRRQAELSAAEAALGGGGGKGGKRVVGVKRVKGQPVVLVVIDASSAPFNEARINEGRSGGVDMAWGLRSQTEEDCREHNIQLDEQDDQSNAPVPAILGIVFHAKKALVGNLMKNRVIRSENNWNDFIDGFTSMGNNQVIDTGPLPSPPLIAPLLLRLAPNPDVKLIYLAGINVEQLKEACPELGDARGAFYAMVGPKLVLINHRESEEELQTLRESSGWRVTQWRRYFSSNNGLGADLGWGFRAPSPYVGPGDQNHEEGADDNGYADLSWKRQMRSDKKQVAKGWGKTGWEREEFGVEGKKPKVVR